MPRCGHYLHQRGFDVWTAAAIAGKFQTDTGLDVTAIENRYAIDFWTYFAAAREQLAQLEADGLVWTCATRIVVTAQGRYLLRVIAGCFDRYIQLQSRGEALQSRLANPA